MIDNTSVVVLRGRGRGMVAVPEMAAFAERLGFAFRAHERGDRVITAVGRAYTPVDAPCIVVDGA